jgi:hypothetical protein
MIMVTVDLERAGFAPHRRTLGTERTALTCRSIVVLDGAMEEVPSPALPRGWPVDGSRATHSANRYGC